MSETTTAKQPQTASRQRIRPWLPYVLGVVPILLFYWFYWQQATNIPYQDDYDGLLEPALAFSRNGLSLADIWEKYSTQDDERRVIMNRFAVHIQYLLTGQINFRRHILFGSLLVLLGLWVFWLWFRRSGLPPIWFLPVPFLLFNPLYFDAVLWSMIPLQQIGVFVWSLLAIWLLTQPRWAFGWAIVVCTLALFSDVSGLLSFVVGGVMLLGQRHWRRLVVWIVVTIIALGAYFYHLDVPAYRPSFADNIQLPGTMLQIWLGMQGLWADVAPQMPFWFRASITIGLGLAAVGLWARTFWKAGTTYLNTRQKPDRSMQFLYGGVLLFLGVFALFALGRTVEGLKAAFLTRYHFIQLCWLVLLYFLFLKTGPTHLLRNRWFRAGALGGSVLFCALAYYNFGPAASNFRQYLLTDLYGWRHHRMLPSSPVYAMHKATIDGWMEAAHAKGIYQNDDALLEALTNAPIVGKATLELHQDSTRLSITLPTLPTPAFAQSADVYVLLRERTSTKDASRADQPRPALIVPATPTRPSLLTYLHTGHYVSTPYRADALLKLYLSDPNPTVELGVVQRGRLMRYQTGLVPTLSLPLRKN